MKIKFCSYYEIEGDEFYGNLAVVECLGESYLGFTQKADELIAANGIKVIEKLVGIPVAVYRIGD